MLWDFPENTALQHLAARIYANQGYVTSVCHGVAGALNIQDESEEYLLKGKRATGFTDTEEILSGKRKLVPFSTEQEAKKRGAHFIKKPPFMKHAVQDGRLITGQNPMSGGAVAELLVKALKA